MRRSVAWTSPHHRRPIRFTLALQRELQPGERILWHGRRLPRVAWSGLAVWVFAVPWTAFALFWTAIARAGTQSFDEAGPLGYAFPLFGTPFIAVGLGMLSLPFLPLFGARRTLFTVTDRRVVRIYLGARLWTKSVPGERIGEIDRSERRDGSGTLKLAVGSHRDSDGDRVTDHFSIGEVADVIAADDCVRELVERCRRVSS